MCFNHHMTVRAILAVGALVFASSCSIKEDRGPCPCHLNIFLENCADYSDMLSVSGWSLDARRLFLDRVDLGGNTKVHTRKVEK